MTTSSDRISTILLRLPEQGTGDRLAVSEIVSALGARGYSILIVILGLPNSLPMPPPIALVSGILMVFISLQILLGRASPWLPSSVLKRDLARADVSRAVERAMPWVRWIEKLAQPRFTFFDSSVGLRVVGFGLLIISLGLVFALPVVGQIPMGIALCLIGLGLVERDGLLVAIGFGIGIVGVAFSYGFLVAVLTGAARLI
ncbi:MAG: hypothetical protein RLZZ496_881 [Pseudomonadota bacterium]|jgi:hypothetical protein|nr:exopolysaccharide biosynthesis protein [Alphaproteobacteria bacterium]